jgi:mono/diheme cytochrome c family protein
LVLLGSLLGPGCTRNDPASAGIQVGAAPAVTPDEAEPCEDTFPANQPVSFKPDFGVDPPTREEAIPRLLSRTPLYSNIRTKEIHPLVHEFKPRFELWSDGAVKTRWAYIPECAKIDTSDMDDWQFPVGTRLFKEFIVDGRRIETRIIERIGEGPRDFAYASYLWDEDEGEARRVDEAGQSDVLGTTWGIPSKSGCLRCHGSYALGGGRPSRGLGLAAIQLSHDGPGLTLSDLIADSRLSHPPAGDITVPGDAVAQAALGVLHANCGHCHNDTPDRLPMSDLSLWVDTDATEVEETATWQTSVGQPTVIFKDQHVSARIEPGQPNASAILYRMRQRGNNAQMPPFGSHIIDEAGVAAIQAWVESLP